MPHLRQSFSVMLLLHVIKKWVRCWSNIKEGSMLALYEDNPGSIPDIPCFPESSKSYS